MHSACLMQCACLMQSERLSGPIAAGLAAVAAIPLLFNGKHTMQSYSLGSAGTAYKRKSYLCRACDGIRGEYSKGLQ